MKSRWVADLSNGQRVFEYDTNKKRTMFGEFSKELKNQNIQIERIGLATKDMNIAWIGGDHEDLQVFFHVTGELGRKPFESCFVRCIYKTGIIELWLSENRDDIEIKYKEKE